MKRHHQISGFIIAAIAVSAPFAHSEEPRLPDALKEAQIKALQTGDIADLKPFSEQAEPTRITATWTILAAKQLDTAKANVSRESALLASEFIFRGASRFVAKGKPIEKRVEAECNLKAFIAAEIAVGALENPEHPKIGEATFSAVTFSLCPLWPFC